MRKTIAQQRMERQKTRKQKDKADKKGKDSNMASDPSSNADLLETPDRESKMTTREKLLAATGSHIIN